MVRVPVDNLQRPRPHVLVHQLVLSASEKYGGFSIFNHQINNNDRLLTRLATWRSFRSTCTRIWRTYCSPSTWAILSTNWRRYSVRVASARSTCRTEFSVAYCSRCPESLTTAAGKCLAKFPSNYYLAGKFPLRTDTGTCTGRWMAIARFYSAPHSNGASCTCWTDRAAELWLHCVRYRCASHSPAICDSMLTTSSALDYSFLLRPTAIWFCFARKNKSEFMLCIGNI